MANTTKYNGTSAGFRLAHVALVHYARRNLRICTIIFRWDNLRSQTTAHLFRSLSIFSFFRIWFFFYLEYLLYFVIIIVLRGILKSPIIYAYRKTK